MQHAWDMRNVYKTLVRKPEVKRLLRIPRCRWEVNITHRMDWIHLDQDTVMNLWVP